MTDDRGDQVLDHLSKAASELIAAARLALDIADDVVTQSVRMIGDATRPAPPAPPPVEKIEVVRRDDDPPFP